MIIAGNVTELVSNSLTVSRLKYDCAAAVGDLWPVCTSAQDGRCFRCCAATVDTEKSLAAHVVPANFNPIVNVPRRSFHAPSHHLFLQPCGSIDQGRKKARQKAVAIPRYYTRRSRCTGDTFFLFLSLSRSKTVVAVQNVASMCIGGPRAPHITITMVLQRCIDQDLTWRRPWPLGVHTVLRPVKNLIGTGRCY